MGQLELLTHPRRAKTDGWRLPIALELGLVAGGAIVVLVLAVWQFNKVE